MFERIYERDYRNLIPNGNQRFGFFALSHPTTQPVNASDLVEKGITSFSAPVRLPLVGEAARLRWIDIDFERDTITLNDPEKNSNARCFKVSNKLIAILKALPKTSERVFSLTTPRSIQVTFFNQRTRIAGQLQNPRLAQIKLHSFRHWKATMEYHKTKDILHVMRMLGHKRIDNTLIYTQLVSFESDEYTCRVAKTEREIRELVEAGFEYVTDYEDGKVFRRRK